MKQLHYCGKCNKSKVFDGDLKGWVKCNRCGARGPWLVLADLFSVLDEKPNPRPFTFRKETDTDER